MFEVLTGLSIFIIVIIFACVFSVMMIYDSMSCECGTFTFIISTIVDLIVSLAITAVLSFFLFMCADGLSYTTGMKEIDSWNRKIYSLSNSNVMESRCYASYDKEYVYFNILDSDSCFVTQKVKMSSSKFRIDETNEGEPYVEVHVMSYKPKRWRKLLFKNEDANRTRWFVFVLKPGQITNKIDYDISRY